MIIKGFYRNIELFFEYFIQFLKVRMSYKGDFLVGTFVSISYHAVSLFSIHVMLQGYPSLNKWSKEEIFFIYAMCAIPLDLFSVFFTNLYKLSSIYIIEGEFDRLLVRPINPLLQLFMEKIHLEKLSGVIVGFAILFYASGKIGVHWTFLNILYIFISIICGVTIFAGIFTAIASLGFWMPDRMGIMPPVWNLVTFGRYPVDIYNPFIRFVICFIIPFAFVAFFPASQIMGRSEFREMALFTPIIAICSSFLGYFVWLQGIKKYESAGN